MVVAALRHVHHRRVVEEAGGGHGKGDAQGQQRTLVATQDVAQDIAEHEVGAADQGDVQAERQARQQVLFAAELHRDLPERLEEQDAQAQLHGQQHATGGEGQAETLDDAQHEPGEQGRYPEVRQVPERLPGQGVDRGVQHSADVRQQRLAAQQVAEDDVAEHGHEERLEEGVGLAQGHLAEGLLGPEEHPGNEEEQWQDERREQRIEHGRRTGDEPAVPEDDDQDAHAAGHIHLNPAFFHFATPA